MHRTGKRRMPRERCGLQLLCTVVVRSCRAPLSRSVAVHRCRAQLSCCRSLRGSLLPCSDPTITSWGRVLACRWDGNHLLSPACHCGPQAGTATRSACWRVAEVRRVAAARSVVCVPPRRVAPLLPRDPTKKPFKTVCYKGGFLKMGFFRGFQKLPKIGS